MRAAYSVRWWHLDPSRFLNFSPLLALRLSLRASSPGVHSTTPLKHKLTTTPSLDTRPSHRTYTAHGDALGTPRQRRQQRLLSSQTCRSAQALALFPNNPLATTKPTHDSYDSHSTHPLHAKEIHRYSKPSIAPPPRRMRADGRSGPRASSLGSTSGTSNAAAHANQA